ncbi:hypothetical protein [Acinetobacter sp. ANC 3882]|uniref:hypothetical protein n=1 Tax=Acinetobacter sp. ANC 3882 TaxID=2923423 RepID=UPI001F4B85D1|nr:hypothetical protein [Acinetobacter sp. ANC 3882]MCH7312915.1 hypothetical protein [Acinetobacter sp. ANC 3882]
MSNRVSTPFPIYSDTDGSPLDAGFIFIGESNKNPILSPIAIFYDAELTMPAENPARTRNGYVVKNGAPRQLFCAEPLVSIAVQNKRKESVWNLATVNLNPGVTTDAVIDTATGLTQAQINADVVQKSQNLNDLPNKEQSRDNLSVYSKAQVDAKIVDATEELKGISRIATKDEVTAGTADNLVVTPKKHAEYFIEKSIGFDQKWQDLTTSREVDTEYTNDTKSPIQVNIIINGDIATAARNTTCEVDGVTIVRTSNANEDAQTKTVSFIVPPASKYKVTGIKSILTWLELRKLPA